MSDEQAKPHRVTLSDQLARQHELLMAAVTKTPPAGAETVTFKQAQVGDLKGQWVCDGLTVRRHDEEDWPQFVGRMQAQLEDVDAELIRRNASLIERQLRQTLDAKDVEREKADNQALRGRIAASKARH